MNTPHHTWSDSPIHELIRNMNTQPTPETDAAYKNHAADMHDHIPLDFARRLERERDKARFDLDFRRRLGDLQNKTIDDLTKQRDEAREYADKLAEGLPEGMLPKDVEVLREANLGLATNIAAVTEQRDMLAVALERLEKTAGLPAWWDDPARVQARQALQSLTPKR